MNIYTLTLSPAYDIHSTAASFEAGRENLVRICSREAGGKGLNISRALYSYGIKSYAVLLLGEENSKDFEKEIRCTGIDALIFKTGGRIRENITVHTASKETRISLEGFSASNSIFKKITEGIHPSEKDILTVTGRIPLGIDIEYVKDYLSGLKEKGVMTVIDSRSFSAADIRDIKPWLIKPNREEIYEYLGERVDSFEDALRLKDKISSLCAENILLTLDRDGAVLIRDGKATYAPPYTVEAISSIGAGDSAVAGFIAAAAEGKNAEDALITATAFGAAACLTEGTRPPRKSDIDRLIGNSKNYNLQGKQKNG